MKTKSLIMIVCLIILGSITIGCGKPKSVVSTTESSKKIKVVASFYPIYDFAVKIGGEKVEVTCLVPAGAEPHDWEPKGKDLANLQSADLFIFNGLGMEPWLNSIQSTLKGTKCVLVDASAGIKLIKAVDEDDKEHQDTAKTHEHTNKYDPHIWLDPIRAKQQALNIKTAMITVSPENKDLFELNYARLAKSLDDLDSQYKSVVSQSKRKEFVVTDPAFGYLAERYGLKQISILGLCTEGEPSPQELKKIVDFARKNKVKHIYFESLYSPKVAETLASEVGAKTLTLSSVHSLSDNEIKQGKDYISMMKTNLENLKISLQDKE